MNLVILSIACEESGHKIADGRGVERSRKCRQGKCSLREFAPYRFVQTPCSGTMTRTLSGSFDCALKSLVPEICSRRCTQDDRIERFAKNTRNCANKHLDSGNSISPRYPVQNYFSRTVRPSNRHASDQPLHRQTL